MARAKTFERTVRKRVTTKEPMVELNLTQREAEALQVLLFCGVSSGTDREGSPCEDLQHVGNALSGVLGDAEQHEAYRLHRSTFGHSHFEPYPVTESPSPLESLRDTLNAPSHYPNPFARDYFGSSGYPY